MRNYRIINTAAFCLAAVLMVSCGRSARISGTMKDLKGSEVIVKLLDVNTYKVLDTVKVDAAGRFSYKVPVEKGQPEFVYVFYGDTKVASLLLETGDKVSVDADTLGNYTVSGSEESILLAGVEKDFSKFASDFSSLAGRLETAEGEAADDLKISMGRLYTDYYRSRVKYVIGNPYSLTVIPVLYQTIGMNLPVFGQETDVMHFNNACDSLETVYPDSRYVKSLRAEAKRRSDILDLSIRLANAEQVNYPDIELPDVNANRVKLSEVDSKVILVHFWTATDAAQKMFNMDVLKPIYEKYHNKGFEIYQVSLDVDKAVWARTVKDQGLGWINVCDGLGANSQPAMLYNVTGLPVSFVISDGAFVDQKISDEASLRRLLDRLLE